MQVYSSKNKKKSEYLYCMDLYENYDFRRKIKSILTITKN